MLERQNSYTDSFVDELDIRSGDMLIVISTSGINPVPVDMLLQGQKAGAKTIAITSAAYSENVLSRHKKQIKLGDAADLVSDNGAPHGDAILTHEN
ncbi:SIS domain-containing protein [Domibacillus sp. A3M-37]|nr:SIS domain-containing protein [Domibacillus sp. A3M-37]MCP3762723.1 SIS domain-containing protein [Domibacillus sp. A3M-37]